MKIRERTLSLIVTFKVTGTNGQRESISTVNYIECYLIYKNNSFFSLVIRYWYSFCKQIRRDGMVCKTSGATLSKGGIYTKTQLMNGLILRL